MIDAVHILQQYWGYTSFRNPQGAIIESVLASEDTIALLPTGGGKSICFQVPALIKEGCCIVISPLIALMQDQVNNLLDKGIKAVHIPSGSSSDDIIRIFDNIRFGNYKFLYISPERLQSQFIQEKLKQLKVNLIAVDEAHCISEWGHDFRPSYRNVHTLRELLPNTPVVALTASATQKVIDDIAQSLAMQQPKIFKKSFYRANLAYQVFTIEDKLYQLKQIFTKTKTPAIVYVNSRKKTQSISNYLNANGFSSSYYHGGLPSIQKQIAFENWMKETTPIMVATNAFGMGIDKSNVGIVVHLDLPNSIENYIQEAGRAGRNGKKSFAVVLQNANDILLYQKLTTASLPSIKEVKLVYQKLYQYFQIALGESNETPFDFHLLEFSNRYNFTPNKVLHILQILQHNGILQIVHHTQQRSALQFIVPSRQLISYGKKYTEMQHLIQTILRIYGGVFEQATKIDEFYIAKKAQLTSTKVIQLLDRLDQDAIVTYKKATANAELYFLQPREDDTTIHRISKHIKSYLQQKKQKADQLVRFIENDTKCRNQQLLQYFNEVKPKPCGICDVCLQQKSKQRVLDISDQILELLIQKGAMTSREICTHFPQKAQDILINLQQLLADEKISINAYNQYSSI